MKFGDLIENTCASTDNPRKFSIFVRYKTIPRGRINSGKWIQCTDGKGKFWLSDPEVIILRNSNPTGWLPGEISAL